MLPFRSESLSPHLFSTNVSTEINRSIILPVLLQLGFAHYLIKIQHSKNMTFQRLALSVLI